jgi:hypothetical protein
LRKVRRRLPDEPNASLDASKSNGATNLDLGGEARVSVKESRSGNRVYVNFEAENGALGRLEIDKEEFDSLK